MIEYINNDWQFCFSWSDEFFDGGKWESIRIPHTVKEIDYNYINEKDYETVCGYKHIIIRNPKWNNKRVFINFDGVGQCCDVYLNRKWIGRHECGYTGFKFEITELLNEGENLLVLKVDTRESLNVPPFGNVIDYLCYGGIYCDAYLSIEEPDFIEDVYAYPTKEEQRYIVHNAVTVNGKKERIFYELFDKEESVLKGTSEETEFDFSVESVKEWDLKNPYLYTLRYRLGNHADYYETVIAFKTTQFRADGFYLNDEKVKLIGLDRHQAYAYVGYAMPDSMQRLDAHILKEQLGLNIVRTSHYPQSHSFIDECDRIGLLVFTEFPGWQYIGNEEWKQVAVKNVEEMILQWRRHPSIILWGVRINESKDDEEFYIRTNAVAHHCDPYRQTGGVRCFEGSQLLEDVYTHNDFSYNGSDVPGLKTKRKGISNDANMDHGYLVTEYCGHMYPTKPFDDEIHRLNHALRHTTVVNSMYEQTDISGCIGWCMADYNTHRDFGAGDRICYHGVLDMFRNRKLASYVYSSQQDDVPVLEVSSEMNAGDHPELNIRDVVIFSNADTVRIYKNDRFMIELKPSKKFGSMPHPPFIMDDHLGELIHNEENYDKESADLLKETITTLKNVGYAGITETLAIRLIARNLSMDDVNRLNDKYIGGWGKDRIFYRFDAIRNGEIVKSVIKASFDELSLDVKASADKLIETKTYDVAEVFVKALDNNGNIAEYYQEALILFAEGPIEIIGPKAISLKAGQIGIYVKSKGEAGKAKLMIDSQRFGRLTVDFEIEIR